MQDENTKGLDTLKHSDWNPRRISKHDFEALKRSILKFGDLSGVVKNLETGTLVGGNQRLEAFLTMPNPKIIITDRLNDGPNAQGTIAHGYIEIGNGERYAYREVIWPLEKEKSANIAANRIQGEFDLDLLAQINYELSQLANASELLEATGQTEEELSRLLDSVAGVGNDPEDDAAPELDTTNPSVSQLGEIYQLGRHRLMCGDSTDFGAVSDLMDGEQADMIFTDPPYNVDYEGKTKDALKIENDSMTDEQFYKFLLDTHVNLAAVTKDGGAIYVCHADMEGLNFRKAFIEAGFSLRSVLIWSKQSMVMGRGDYHWQHEPILYGWKEGGAHYFVADRTQTTVWNIDRPSRNEEHPTMKPVALCKRAILNSSKRGENVVDVFGGSGSTLIAADEIERNCYMMELDPRYCDVIRKRYANHIGSENWEEVTPVVQPAAEVAGSHNNEIPVS